MKHAAASSRKGVVGRRGTKTPTVPSPTQAHPTPTSSDLRMPGVSMFLGIIEHDRGDADPYL